MIAVQGSKSAIARRLPIIDRILDDGRDTQLCLEGRSEGVCFGSYTYLAKITLRSGHSRVCHLNEPYDIFHDP